MSEPITLKEEEVEAGSMSRRAARRDRIEERRATRRSGGLEWLVGLVLIGIGAGYLLHNAGYLPAFDNWWALFMLLPAVGLMSAALGAYRNNGGEWTSQVILLLVGGLMCVGFTAILLFELSFGWYLPLFLIGGGLLLLAVPFLTRR